MARARTKQITFIEGLGRGSLGGVYLAGVPCSDRFVRRWPVEVRARDLAHAVQVERHPSGSHRSVAKEDAWSSGL